MRGAAALMAARHRRRVPVLARAAAVQHRRRVTAVNRHRRVAVVRCGGPLPGLV